MFGVFNIYFLMLYFSWLAATSKIVHTDFNKFTYYISILLTFFCSLRINPGVYLPPQLTPKSTVFPRCWLHTDIQPALPWAPGKSHSRDRHGRVFPYKIVHRPSRNLATLFQATRFFGVYLLHYDVEDKLQGYKFKWLTLSLTSSSAVQVIATTLLSSFINICLIYKLISESLYGIDTT